MGISAEKYSCLVTQRNEGPVRIAEYIAKQIRSAQQRGLSLQQSYESVHAFSSQIFYQYGIIAIENTAACNYLATKTVAFIRDINRPNYGEKQAWSSIQGHQGDNKLFLTQLFLNLYPGCAATEFPEEMANDPIIRTNVYMYIWQLQDHFGEIFKEPRFWRDQLDINENEIHSDQEIDPASNNLVRAH